MNGTDLMLLVNIKLETLLSCIQWSESH